MDLADEMDKAPAQDIMSRLVFALTIGEPGKPDSWRLQAGAQHARCEWLVNSWAQYPLFVAQPRPVLMQALTSITLPTGIWCIGELSRSLVAPKVALKTSSQKDGALARYAFRSTTGHRIAAALNRLATAIVDAIRGVTSAQPLSSSRRDSIYNLYTSLRLDKN